ncbi:NAD(P)/FAD-dependent oxidoreductase [Noviherbaspirillum cavernae]|uniref:NAD(P)/FAD-dependent oxidoreductase n=1 Tax=Noviherbaspirillum cavernae TaxID=2320862 RepID=A0A418X5C7_9BURK|nr:NAD(P)/FAD-dependent oxidoreductase [Noviherbaspirillum cavernae]RJG07693.1 NAD(P)/FAD-dependent oxidoreductase [Noviherbaspirillum cavernae]
MKANAAAPEVSECDVLVIGGGPAGSTAAALLAQKGYRVTLLEKARHPRFHIGESLLPANLPLLEKLGVADEVRAIGMEKWAAEFVSPWHDHKQVFHFADAIDKSMPYAYQVQRAEFDEILIRNAARKGAHVIEGCRVKDVAFLPDDQGAVIEAQHDDGTAASWRARFVLDASGRDTFLGNRFKAKVRNEKHNSTAIYAHFDGVTRNEGRDEGNISIYWFEHGWFWFIPLANGKTSIGAVTWPYYLKTRKKPVAEFLMDTIALCPKLMERMQGAQIVSDTEATGNYSYVCDRTHGANYLLLGDAYTFIDPVFSSGVMLAMNSAFVGADTVDECLSRPAQAAAALKRFDRSMRVGPKQFSWFIYRVTNPTMRDLFMGPRNLWRMQEALLSVLAGDVFGKTRIGAPLLAFKGVYYGVSLLNWKRTYTAWRNRRNNIRRVDDIAGMTN